MAIAELLRNARERRGLTLDRLAEETKIPRGRLAAFEQEGFRPDGGFYQRAQIRACAQALSLDEQLVLKELTRDAAPVVAAASPEAVAPRVTGARVSSVLMTIGCLVAVAVVAATQFTRDPDPAPHPAEAVSQPASSYAVDPPIHQGDDSGSVEAREPASRATVGIAEPDEAPAIAAVPAMTELVITSHPEGARVTVDGVGWGVTPLTIRHLPAGPKRIRLTSDGYVAAERVMDVQPGGARSVAVELLRASPSITAEP